MARIAQLAVCRSGRTRKALLYAYFPSPAYNDRSRDYVPTILAARPKQNIKTSETMNGERVSHRSDRVDIRI